jgi:hypothetical protein
MAIKGTCKCGTDPVTSAAEGLKWAMSGCEDCGEKVTFDIPKSDKKRPGRN